MTGKHQVWRQVLALGARAGVIAPSGAELALRRIEEAPDAMLAEVASWAGVEPGVIEDLQRLLDASHPPPDLPTMPLPPSGASTPPTAPAATLSPAIAASRGVPRRLGPYDLIEELGHGGMGIVYRARHEKLGTPCAVKVMIAGEHASPEEIERFTLEARSVAKMGKHPNIVAVYDLDTQGSLTYFAMELVEGRSLARMLREREEPFTPQETARLAEKVARAVHFAHEKGIIHRDLKPDNVVLRSGPEGALEPQVMDFGLARDVTSTERRSVAGQVMGSPNWMAPEQARGDVEGIDRRTDVYGVGAILYEMLTGNPPHPGKSWPQVAVHILRGEVVSPRSVRPETPRDLETVCLKALETEPSKRYATAEELANDLARFQRGEPVHARPIGRIERIARTTRRHKAKVIPATIALLVAAASLIYVVVYRAAEARARSAHELAQLGTLMRNENRPDEALRLFQLALELAPGSETAREGVRWATENSAWKLVYDSGGGAPLDADWVPAMGYPDCWRSDPSEATTIVAESTTAPAQGLLVLQRWLPGDVRIEYEVLQETEPLGDIGCFLASDIRGWEYIDPLHEPREVWGTGYFVGIGSGEGNRLAKILGPPKVSNPFGPLIEHKQEGILRGAGVWHRVQVERRGPILRVWAGVAGEELGEPMLDFTDATSLPRSNEHAYCGLYKWGGRYRYRNVRVRTRGINPEDSRLAAEVGRAFQEAHAGRYAAHQDRLERVLPAFADGGRAWLRSEWAERIDVLPGLMHFAASPLEVRRELALLWEGWRWGLVKGSSCYECVPFALRDDPEALLAVLERLLGDPGVIALKEWRPRWLRARVLMELGRWSEALPEFDRLPRNEWWIGEKGLCLMGMGQWEEALALWKDAAPVLHAPLAADRGKDRPEDIARASVTWSESPPTRVLRLALASLNPEPGTWVLTPDGPTPVDSAVLAGLIAGADGDRAAMVAEWARQSASQGPLAPEPPGPGKALMEFHGKSLVAHLGGSSGGEYAEAYRLRQWRHERVWISLAMAIRAEEDRDVAEAERLYRCVIEDDVGLLLPRRWARQGLARLR